MQKIVNIRERARTNITEKQILLSVPDAAALLGLGSTAGWVLARSGALPTVRIGRRVLIPRAALEEYAAGLSTNKN